MYKCIVAACAIASLAAAAHTQLVAPATENLLLSLDQPIEHPGDPEVVSASAIAIRTDLLESSALAGTGQFALELGGESLRVRFTGSREASGGGYVWSGEIEGAEWSSVMFSVLNGAVAATIRYDETLWSVRPRDGVHALLAIDDQKFPLCGTGPEHVVVSPQGEVPDLGAKGGTAGETMDVLVAYSPQARSSNGGTNGINALINLAVAETNDAYQNSLITTRVRLVHTVETAQNETSDMIQVIQRLRSTSDGWYDEVHGLRDQYGGDFVAMIVANGNFCGVGYLMQNVSKSFASSAFSVTLDSCATGNYTFGHELGHNQGCHHDRANAGSTPAYPYSYGYRTPNNQWRTVMSYSPGTRIKYMSTPDVSFGGFPLGIAHPDPNSAHNARGIDEAAPTFSQFRCAIPVAYGTGMPTSQGPDLTLGYSGAPRANGSGNFTADVSNALPNKPGLLFYGFDSAMLPLVGGTLYVEPPLSRLTPVITDGSGQASLDFIGLINPLIGEDYYLQFWARDAQNPAGQGSALSNGLRVDVCD